MSRPQAPDAGFFAAILAAHAIAAVGQAEGGRRGRSARGAGEGSGSMPGTNNAFVEVLGVQKTHDGETLVVEDLRTSQGGSF